MAKKIFTYLAIILACGVLFVMGSFLLMILAPGMEVFGIRYVTSGEGDYELAEADQRMPAFAGDIYIEANEIPITVDYQFVNGVVLKYKQGFVGFTKSKNKKPYVEYKVEKGDLHIKSYDLVKFLYGTESFDVEECYLNLILPYEMSEKSIFIKSNNSAVKFNAEGSRALEEVDISTKNTINIVGTLSAHKIILETRQPLVINESIQTNHLKIKASTNNVKMDRDFDGLLEVETANANLYIKNVNNLLFKSSSGSVMPYDDKEINVGVVNVETKSGSVEINNIIGILDSEITTKSGRVSVGNCNNITITNNRGPVKIGNAKNLTINGGLGVVNVNSVSQAISVETKNGNVILGSEETTIANPTVVTSTGKVNVINASGKALLTSMHNSVSVDGKDLTEITIAAGKEVNAKNLSGEISIDANRKVDVQITKLTGDVKIKTGDKCKLVNVDLSNYILNAFNYHFKSTKARLANIYIGEELKEGSKSDTKREPYIAGLKTVVIETTYADMNIYTK